MEMHVGQFFSECLLCWVLTVLPSHKCYSSWVISRGQSRGSLWREKKALAQVPIYVTLYKRQQKRHRYKEQTFGLCGKRQGWDDLREQHWNMYITICKIDDQCMKQSQCSGTTKRDKVRSDAGGGFRRGGHMCTWGWLMLMCGKSYHSIVK